MGMNVLSLSEELFSFSFHQNERPLKRYRTAMLAGAPKNAVKLKFEKDKGEDETRRIEKSHAVWDERKKPKGCSQAEETRKKKKITKKSAPRHCIVHDFFSSPQAADFINHMPKHFFLLIPVHMPSIRRYIISHSARSAQRKHRDCASRCRQSPGSLCSRG